MRNNLKTIRTRRGVTQEALGEALGYHYTTINRVENRPELSPAWVRRLARYFDVSESELIGVPVGNNDNEPRTDRRIPVYGLAAGAVRGHLTLSPDPVEWVRAMPGIANVRDAYAMIVTGSSMEPRYLPGEIIYLHPHRPPRPGDHIAIQEMDKDGVSVSLKRFERMTETHLITTQYNPPAEVRFLRSRIQAVHRVLTLNELSTG